MKEPPVDLAVCQACVKKYWSPLRYYSAEGFDTYVEALQSVAISLDHCEATAKAFDQDCPTPFEIRETGFRLREKFQPKAPSLEEQWIAQGCTRDPVETTYYQELLRKRKAGDDPISRQMWKAIRYKLTGAQPLSAFAEMTIGQCYAAAKSLGFPLNSDQLAIEKAWHAAHSIRLEPVATPKEKTTV